MPKVNLTSAEWDWILILLRDSPGYISDPIFREIDSQLAKQEN